MSSLEYAGESWLQPDLLPDYKTISKRLSFYITLAFAFWLVVVPIIYLLAASEERDEKAAALEQQEREQEAAAQQQKAGTRRSKTNRQKQVSLDDNNQQESQVPSEFYVSLFASLGFVWTLILILTFISPHNTLLARGVFSCPILSLQESKDWLTRVEVTAQRNVESVNENDADPMGYLKLPPGFSKVHRYNQTLTTSELSVLTDPFTKADREWLMNTLLQTRLAPTIRRVYGVTLESINLQDLYVDQYTAGTRRTFRIKEENGNRDYDVAFRILLNDDFTGGSTRFWNSFQKRFIPYNLETVPQNVGTMLLHNNRLLHEDEHVRDGQKTILVGTVSIQRQRDDNGNNNGELVSTGVSAFASYFSFPWLVTRLEAFIQRQSIQYNKTTKVAFLTELLRDLLDSAICDTWLKHEVYTLVKPEDGESFRSALDQKNHVIQAELDNLKQPRWFTGKEVTGQREEADIDQPVEERESPEPVVEGDKMETGHDSDRTDTSAENVNKNEEL